MEIYIGWGIIAFVLVCVFLYVISLLNVLFRNVPQVATFGEGYRVLQEHADEIFIESGKVIDLGSGTGKVARFLSSLPGISVDGYEVDISNVLIARILGFVSRSSSRFFLKNFFVLDEKKLSEYKYVYIYLFPHVVKRIEEEVFPKLAPGTMVIVNAFSCKNHDPITSYKDNSGKKRIFLYKV